MPFYTPLNEALISSIESNDPTFIELKLFMPNSPNDEVARLVQALESNTTIKSLTLNNVFGDRKSIECFADYIKNNRSLTSLRFESQRSTRKNALLHLTPVISALKENKFITDLSFLEFKLTIEEVKALVDMLPANASINFLRFYYTGIDALGANALIGAFERNYGLTEIDLQFNVIVRNFAWLSFYAGKPQASPQASLESTEDQEKNFKKGIDKRIKQYQKRNEYIMLLNNAVKIMQAVPFNRDALEYQFKYKMLSEQQNTFFYHLINIFTEYYHAGSADKQNLALQLFYLLEMMLKDKNIDHKALPDDLPIKSFMQFLIQPTPNLTEEVSQRSGLSVAQ